MSSSSSTKATAVIIGGTGELGVQISKIFLSEYRTNFPTVRITTRNTDSPKARELAKLGAEVHAFSESLDVVLSGADVVVNALPGGVALKQKTELAHALVRNNVKVYFLSEYGAEYHLDDFPGYSHPEWIAKTETTAETRVVTQGKTNLKVVALMIGMFLGHVLRPGMGIDVENNAYTRLGPGSPRIAVTAESDIGRAIARLAVLALDPATASKVPDNVRIAGQNVSYEEIRDAIVRYKGVARGEIHTKDLAEFKNGLRERNSTATIYEYVSALIWEGKFDFSSDNHNELINPDQSLWKWKTVEDRLAGRA